MTEEEHLSMQANLILRVGGLKDEVARLKHDIAHWAQLAKAQRDWFESHGPHGKNTSVCPTDAAIEASERLLGREVAYPAFGGKE